MGKLFRFFILKDFHFSKPFTYALSLDQLGIDVMKNFIGREPSGGNFNEITLDYSGKNEANSKEKKLFTG